MQEMVTSGFVERIESEYGAAYTEALMERAGLDPGEVFSPADLIRLGTLIRYTGTAAQQRMLRDLGRCVFYTFGEEHPHVLSDCRSAFPFLVHAGSVLENSIAYRAEFRQNALRIALNNTPGAAELTEGLIDGVLGYFNEDVVVDKRMAANHAVTFTLTRKAIA
ncbi:MAG: hypothetical protein INR69_05590 [Mucilaginibacter polytrichastri]|nr:hypothetical protein [Mucilaginibacter polytrichastri]